MFPLYKDSVVDGDSKINSRVAAAFEQAWAAIYVTAQEYLDDIEELGLILEGMNTFSMSGISEELVTEKKSEYKN